MGFERTVFLTYMLATSSVSGSTNNAPYAPQVTHGYATAVHCNYIEKIETPTLINKTINFVVPDGSLFPFLRDYYQIDPTYVDTLDPLKKGWGFNANRIYALVQIVEATGSTVTADPANWSIIDVTPQLADYDTFSATTIPVGAFNSSTIITVGVQEVLNAAKYDLTYLSNPSNLSGDDTKLAFGEEAFFYGNVNSEIMAIAYTTEIPAVMPLNEYNSTTNETWDESSAVTISEMGIFNTNNDLVGIGKLNNPIDKDSTIYRTLLFSIDF